jgi:hypothetical protein
MYIWRNNGEIKAKAKAMPLSQNENWRNISEENGENIA